jgi:hypothetical protein
MGAYAAVRHYRSEWIVRAVAWLDGWVNDAQPSEPESEPMPPTPTAGMRHGQHAIEWARYAHAFVSGGKKIGSFSRAMICEHCPQRVERVLADGSVTFGPMVTQADWKDLTDALIEAGLMYKSPQGTNLRPGVLSGNVYEVEAWPRRRCPVQRYIDPRANNWTRPPTPNETDGDEKTGDFPRTTPTA